MTPTASPRHPWKALAAVLAMFAVVHGARAHVHAPAPEGVRVFVNQPAAAGADCTDPDGDPDDEPATDLDFDAA